MGIITDTNKMIFIIPWVTIDNIVNKRDRKLEKAEEPTGPTLVFQIIIPKASIFEILCSKIGKLAVFSWSSTHRYLTA